MLLTPKDPSVVRVFRPNAPSEFFLAADHAGALIPPCLNHLGLPESERLRHIAWDIGIAGVTRNLSEALNATAIMQSYSRLVIDCNRDPSWPSAIPTVSEVTQIPGNKRLKASERLARIEEIFQPYHDTIAAHLDQRAGRRTIFVAMHSFTPRYKGVDRPMHAGILHLKDPKLAYIMLDLLRQEPGLVVGDNEPYAITEDSDYTVPTHASKRGLHHLEIEIRQDLIANADGQQEWADRFARLLPLASAALG
jgi:predicted N-formylglutamate amidohydrolase